MGNYTSWTDSSDLYYIKLVTMNYNTTCPGRSDPFYTVSYYIKWVTNSWTHSTILGQTVKIDLGYFGQNNFLPISTNRT